MEELKNYNIIKNRLKELRQERHIESQRALALEICKRYGEKAISHGAIRQMELGTANPNWDTIRLFCDFFRVTPQYLLGISDTEDEIFDRSIERVLLGLFGYDETSYIRDVVRDEVKEYIKKCCGKDWGDIDIRKAVSLAIMKRLQMKE